MKATLILILLVHIVMFAWFASQTPADRKSMANNPSVENTLRVWNNGGE